MLPPIQQRLEKAAVDTRTEEKAIYELEQAIINERIDFKEHLQRLSEEHSQMEPELLNLAVRHVLA